MVFLVCKMVSLAIFFQRSTRVDCDGGGRSERKAEGGAMRGPLFRPQTVCGQRSGQSPRLQGTPEARRLTGTVGARRSGNTGRLAPPRCHGGSCLAVFRAARTGRRGRGGCTRATWRRPSPPFPLARLPSAFSPATAEPARASERGAEGGGHPPTRSSIHSSQPVRVHEVTGACLGPGWLPEGHNPRIWPRLQASAYARTSAQPPRSHRPRASPDSGICPAPAICLARHSVQHVTCEQGADPSEATLVRARAHAHTSCCVWGRRCAPVARRLTGTAGDSRL